MNLIIAVLEPITVFTILSLIVRVVKWLIYNCRLSCCNPKGLNDKKEGKEKEGVGESGERMEGVLNKRVEGM